MTKNAQIIYLVPLLFVLSGCVRVDEVKQAAKNTLEQAVQEIENTAVSLATDSLSVGTAIKGEQSANPPALERVLLNVPFVSQAPRGDWGLPYQEACEEAALIQAAKYFRNEPLTKEIMEEEIARLVAWEVRNAGRYTDSTAAEVADMAGEYFDLHAEVVADIGLPRIKQELRAGNLILLPTAGRLLGNPNYSDRGPLYHFLVLRGFRGDTIITNDPGTRKGERYEYAYETLRAAAHDLPRNGVGEVFRPYEDKDMTEEDKELFMLKGEPVMIVVSQ